MTPFIFTTSEIEAMEPATRQAVAKALLKAYEPDVDWDALMEGPNQMTTEEE